MKLSQRIGKYTASLRQAVAGMPQSGTWRYTNSSPFPEQTAFFKATIKMTTAFYTHTDCLRHEMGDWHPEAPVRLQAIEDQLIASRIDQFLERREAPLASLEDIGRVHTGSAINRMLLQHANDLNLPLKLRIQVTSYDALCLMVDSGLGVALLPAAVASHHAKNLAIRVITLNETWARRELRICVRAYDALPVAAKLLVSHLRRDA